MKIHILMENQTGHTHARTCKSEWGFSVWIEKGNEKILFDAGYSGAFAENAQSMGLDLEQTSLVALSHYHWDHVNGLARHPFRSSRPLLCHPDLLPKLPDSLRKLLEQDFQIRESQKAVEWAPGCWFLGEIPRKSSFESGCYKEDPMREDTALALTTEQGCVVVSGCAHAGIVNICQQAEAVTGLPLQAVLGGFHLTEKNKEAVEGALDYFRHKRPSFLAPLHCVDFPVLCRFRQEFGIQKYSCGDQICL